MTASERATKKAEKLDLVDLRIHAYNSQAERLEPFIKSYWAALKECWQQPKNTDRDNSILAKYGLGEIHIYYKPAWQYPYGSKPEVSSICLSWNTDLFNLNKELGGCYAKLP